MVKDGWMNRKTDSSPLNFLNKPNVTQSSIKGQLKDQECPLSSFDQATWLLIDDL